MRATLVLAPNPGPMTLDGTNTWVLREPGSDACVVVDPGPDLDRHLDAVEAAADGARIALVVLTHGHADHSEAAPALAARTGAPVRAFDPRHRLGEEGLTEGQVVEVGGLEVRVVETPGHSSDSVSLLLPADGSLLTGDTVLGRGTTVVAHPDGVLGDYLDSLRKLQGLDGVTRLLPGHGPVLDDPAAVLDHYWQHRMERLQQVRAAVAAGDRTPMDVVRRVYADVDERLWPAAELSVRAQLEHLRC